MHDSIPISALQHYAFCPRQCAYIHIERLWQDNFLTAKGNQLHERVNSGESEKRGNIKTERSVQVSSGRYGPEGQLDLLEIQSEPFSLTLIEHKRGKPKINDCDSVSMAVFRKLPPSRLNQFTAAQPVRNKKSLQLAW